MRHSAWRIAKASRAASAFDGEGAKRYGGRWNSPGTRMIYASGSRALAVLEVLVHLDASTISLNFKIFQLEFDDSLVEELDAADLPAGWNHLMVHPAAQRVGDAWIAKARRPVLRVPSAIVDESNFLLNPAHPLFGRIRIDPPRDFRLDPRLK